MKKIKSIGIVLIEYKWNNVWAKTVLDFTRSVGFNNPNQFNKLSIRY